MAQPSDTRVLVTGGTSGLGRAMAQALTQRDAQRANLLDPAIMGPPIVWLASPDAAGVHDERIVARDFDDWLRAREKNL